MIFKKFDRSDWLNFVGLILGVAAAIYFYYGSEAMPWSIQTWGGNSIEEVMFRNQHYNMARVGFLLLFFQFSVQLTALLWKKKQS